MWVSTKLFLILAFFITLIEKIFSEYNPNNLIYSGKVKSLVLIDDWHVMDSHSLFWNQLKGNNN